MDLGSLLASKARIAAEELQLVRAALSHRGQKGSAMEQSVLRLLEDHLPARLGVTEGAVVASSGYMSPQLDIIIYDKSAAQILYCNGPTRIVPIEYVFAVGEVKSVLDRAGYDRFFQCQKELKLQQKRFVADSERWTYHCYGAEWRRLPVASFMFGFEGAFQPLHDAYVANHSNEPINQCIDTVVCPTKFSLHRSSEYGADLYQGTRFALNGVREHALFFFLGMLGKASTEWIVRETPEMYRYFMGVGGIPNSLITTGPLPRPDHPDILRLSGP